jgi:hypothetical protein
MGRWRDRARGLNENDPGFRQFVEGGWKSIDGC